MREQRRKTINITGGGDSDSVVASGSGMAAPRASGSMAVAESEDVDVCAGPGIHSANRPSHRLHSQTSQMSMMMAKLDLPWQTTAVSSCKWRVWRISSRISRVRFVRETWQLLSSTRRPCRWITHCVHLLRSRIQWDAVFRQDWWSWQSVSICHNKEFGGRHHGLFRANHSRRRVCYTIIFALYSLPIHCISLFHKWIVNKSIITYISLVKSHVKGKKVSFPVFSEFRF